MSLCAATGCWLRACETVKRRRLAAGSAPALLRRERAALPPLSPAADYSPPPLLPSPRRPLGGSGRRRAGGGKYVPSGTKPAKLLLNDESDIADVRESIGSRADRILQRDSLK